MQFIECSPCAITYGQDGTRYVNQTVEIKEGYVHRKSQAPKYSKDELTNFNHRPSDYFIDSVVNPLPYSAAVMSVDWTFFQQALSENSKQMSVLSKPLTIKVIDVYGVFYSRVRKFIFREVSLNEEAGQAIQERLNRDIPSDESLVCSISKAIRLTQLSIGINKASWREIDLIAFYYLLPNMSLRVSLDNNTQVSVRPVEKPLIFVYPIHPNVEKTKINTIVERMKKLCREVIEVTSVDQHPIEIEEPSTIKSFP